MLNKQSSDSNKLGNSFVDTDQTDQLFLKEQQTTRRKIQSNFFARYKYAPVYILGLVLVWILANVIENFDDDWFAFAQFAGIPFAFILVWQKKKFENKWIFHTLFAFIVALWLLPLIVITMVFGIIAILS